MTIGSFSELRRRLYLPEKTRYCQKRDVTPRLLRLSVFLFHVFYCRKRRAIKFLENGVCKHVLSKIYVFTFLMFRCLVTHGGNIILQIKCEFGIKIQIEKNINAKGKILVDD